MIVTLRIATIAPALALALVASPVQASVIFNVTGTYSDGGTLSGTFTTDDALTALQSTSLTVSGGSLGLDGVIFNDASYIAAAGSQNLPNSFSLLALSSVNKSLGLVFVTPLTLAGATLSTASDNYQQYVGTRTIVSGSVSNANTTPVPEPASWALMLTGFAALGLSFRHRRDRLAFA
jgi:PEP-CTERM putative exosortase interaction domain